MLMRPCQYLVAAFLALFGACLLAGCTSAGMVEHLSPEMGGLPADTPAKPSTQYQYPAVHDMPPARPVPALNETQQTKLQEDLNKLRDRQESLNAEAAKTAAKTATKPKAKPAAKKKPSNPNVAGQAAGAKTNP